MSQKERENSTQVKEKYVNEMVKAVLILDHSKKPFKQADISKFMSIKLNRKQWSSALEMCKSKLEEMGLSLLECQNSDSKLFFLVSNVFPLPSMCQYADENEVADRTLLILVLTYIFMKEGTVTDVDVFNHLEELKIYNEMKQVHDYFGDVKKKILKDFVSQLYLEKTAIPDSEKAELKWGERALAEVTKESILKFVCEIGYEGTIEPKNLASHYQAALEEAKATASRGSENAVEVMEVEDQHRDVYDALNSQLSETELSSAEHSDSNSKPPRGIKMKEVQELDIYVHPSSLMHNYWVALCVVLVTAGGGVLAVIACWYKKCRQSNGSYAYTALEPGSNAHERLELETKACERAHSICSNHLKSNPRYTLLYQLNDVGSRVGKHWFVVRDASVKTERLLTLVPRTSRCPLRCDPESRAVVLDLFLALQHPYIYPILDINFRDIGTTTFIFTTLPLNEKGSLKDFIYKSRWQDNWGQKYFQRGGGLPLSQIQRLGRQILEALLFLREKGFPPCGHFHTGNIVLQNGVARLTGLENALFGFKSRIHPVLLPRARSEPDAVDSLCFGHVLFEMCAGYELDTPQPSPTNLLDIHHYPQVLEVIDFIFHHPLMRLPAIEELLLCDLFRNIDLREIRNQAQSTQVFKTNLTPRAADLLKEIKRIQKGKERLRMEASFEGDWQRDKSTSSGGSDDEVNDGDYDADTNTESENSRKKEHRCLSLHANASNKVFLSVRRKCDD